jgi:hypothetical protein
MVGLTLELKIAKLEKHGWDWLLHPQSEAQSLVIVDSAYVKAYAPQPGGTYIRLANGSEGYAPPGAGPLQPAFDESQNAKLIDAPQPGDTTDPEDTRELEP